MMERVVGPGFVGAAVATAAVALLLPTGRLDLVAQATAALALIALVLFAIYARRLNGRLVLDPPLLVLTVFIVWHFSFWVLYTLGLASSYRIGEYTQFADESTQLALLASLSGMLALAGGLALGRGKTPWSPVETAPVSPFLPYAVAVAGAALVVVYFAGWGHELVGRYENVFLDEDPARRLLNLGIVLVLPSAAVLMHVGEGGKRRIALLGGTVIPTVAIAGVLGSRWVLLSACLLTLSALSMRAVRIRWVRLIAIGLALVLLSTAVKEVRDDTQAVGSLGSLLFERHTNPVIEFFEEIGHAFVAVAGTIEMHAGGDRYLWGRSFAHAALSVAPSLPQLTGIEVVRPPHELAETYFEPRYSTEGYTIGYSLVAELYASFGLVGVVAGLAAAGYGFGRLYRRFLLRDDYATLFVAYAVCAFALFGLRNDLYTWLRSAVWAAILFGFIGWWLDRRGPQPGFGPQESLLMRSLGLSIEPMLEPITRPAAPRARSSP